MDRSEVIATIVILAGVVVLLGAYSFFSLWFTALAAGARIDLPLLIFMKLRKVSPRIIVNSHIIAVKAGVHIGIHEMEAHYLAGGDVPRAVSALVAANKAGIPLTFGQVSAIDLSGRDVLDFVKSQVIQKDSDAFQPEKPDLVGQAGFVVTAFRPAGTVVVDGQHYEAVSDGDCIEEGETVNVLGWEDGWVVVARSEA